MALDGEIWFGRSTFMEALKISSVPELHRSIDWSYLRIIAFDSPDMEHPRGKAQMQTLEGENEDGKKWERELKSGNTPFELRYKRLLENANTTHAFEVASSIYCKSRVMLHELLDKIFAAGGEGMVIRKNKSSYCHGRSDLLLKLKTNRDQEGLVVNKKGGIYFLKLPSNQVIKAIRSATLSTPPKIGELVTFIYFQRSKKTGAPALGQIQVVRNDMTWQEAVYNFRFNSLPKRPLDTKTPRELQVAKLIPPSSTSHSPRYPSGYFTSGASGNIRKFLDAFARARNLDPLNPESWYKVTAPQIEAVKVCKEKGD